LIDTSVSSDNIVTEVTEEEAEVNTETQIMIEVRRRWNVKVKTTLLFVGLS